MATRWTAQQTCSTSTPSLAGQLPWPHISGVSHIPLPLCIPIPKHIQPFLQNLGPYTDILRDPSKTLQMAFLSLVFPYWNGKGQIFRDALRGDFPQALLGLMLYCPFPRSTYRSVKHPVDAFCSAWFIQQPGEEGCLGLFLFICRVTQ